MENIHKINKNIYITSDEEIKEGDYVLSGTNTIIKCMYPNNVVDRDVKKIILTTDPKLIADKVQAIDDEFLQWFIKNPSCEKIEVVYDKDIFPYGVETAKGYGWYEIIIPKEEPKQDTTLEEAAEDNAKKVGHYAGYQDFIAGAKWQEERIYSEEEVYNLLLSIPNFYKLSIPKQQQAIKEWFKQYKKK